jgi:hypothetical protein
MWMKLRFQKLFLPFIIFGFCILVFFGRDATADVQPHSSFYACQKTFPSSDNLESKEKKISESWMGVYMNGIKVGYNFNQEFSLVENGIQYTKEVDESWIRVSRLGGTPVELITIQESLYDAQGRPLECILRTKMSESETVIKAEISHDKIIFLSENKVIKELPYEEFFLGTPVEKIIEEKGLTPGQKHTFKILDFMTYSLVETNFEVVGRENVLILGEKLNLWHIRENTKTLIPISIDEWIDDAGSSMKSITMTGFIDLTSIRMSKENALEVSEENFDIAFSTLIKSNVAFDNPQEVQEVKFKLSGVSSERIKSLPFDGRSQKILELGKDYALIQTSSQIFKEEDALLLPITEKKINDFLKPTSFCQSDDQEIQKKAEEIVGEEKNSWKSAKKIAEWIKNEMTSNYDVGFAHAKEILRNREGDCSEYTVLTVAFCRAVGIPARAAVGIMYGRGIFAYHMWPEVFVGRWISLDPKWLAVDKKTMEYYTDATHIKFGHSLLGENIFKEMAQAIAEIIGQLKLEVIDYYQDR